MTTVTIPSPQQTAESRWSDLGERVAREHSGASASQPLPAHRHRQFQATLSRASVQRDTDDAAAILDNLRFLRGIERHAAEFLHSARDLPAAAPSLPRITTVVRHYLDRSANRFDESEFTAFLDGYQRVVILNIGELAEARAALEVELLDRLIAAQDHSAWPAIVISLQRVGNANWRDIIQAVNYIDRVLTDDPAGAYARMDFESRALYRRAVEQIARHSPHTEVEIAHMAVRLSRAASGRAAHVGYYLIDRGLAQLESEAAFRPPLATRLRRLLLRYPSSFYLISIELLTFLIVVGMLSGLNRLTPIFAGLILLLLPASQAAVDFVNNFITSLLPARPLPKLDFSEGIPGDCVTLVAVPALLLNEEQVHDLVLDLEIRFLANRDPNLYFALLTDAPDSDQPVDQKDSLVDLALHLIEGLNARYQDHGRSPFFLLHRYRTYNESEGRWMGWERKRGKLLDLNRALRGHLDAFPVRSGDESVLSTVRYVITLDADTQLPRDSAIRMVGTIAHPLNQAVVDPRSNIVVEGYGILQPRVGISIQTRTFQNNLYRIR